MNRLEDILDAFGIVTVMNICVFKLDPELIYCKEPLNHQSFNHTRVHNKGNETGDLLFLDTLKISNLNESAPQKTFKAGKINIPVIRHGKQTTLTINDALGRIDTLIHFFNLRRMPNFETFYSVEEFAEPLALEGEMKIVNLRGETETLYLFIPCFLPDGKLTLTQDAEGAFGIFDLSGQLFPMLLSKTNENGEETQVYTKYLIGRQPFYSQYEQEIAAPVYEYDTVAAVPIDWNEYDDSIIYDEDSVAVESAFEEN